MIWVSRKRSMQLTAATAALLTHIDGYLLYGKSTRVFLSEYRADLDRQTTYEIISAYEREEELLYFAETAKDYSYILHLWINQEHWKEATTVLAKQAADRLRNLLQIQHCVYTTRCYRLD
jgi:hypothetical protein